MPIYDYQCRNCGHRVELIHGVNASGPTACEQCGGPMRKLLSTPSIVFKGSGWAKKDRSSASSRSTSKSEEPVTPAASPEASSKPESTAGEGSSTTAKPDTKTPAKDTTSASGTGPTD